MEAGVLSSTREDTDHHSRAQQKSDAAEAAVIGQHAACSVTRCKDGFCVSKCSRAAPGSYRQSNALSSSSEGRGMQHEEQQRTELQRLDPLSSCISKDGLKSFRARQQMRKDLLITATRRPGQGSSESVRPIRLKQALAIVAEARARLPSSGAEQGGWRFPRGLAERRRDIRLAAKYMQDRKRSNTLKVFQSYQFCRGKGRITSSSSDGST